MKVDIALVAQRTRYDQDVKLKYVEYINDQIKIGWYQTQDIVSMDETNFYVDLQAGATLTNRGKIIIGQSLMGNKNRCNVLLAVTMPGEKLQSYIIFNGKAMKGS
jgi:hypothetical protein